MGDEDSFDAFVRDRSGLLLRAAWLLTGDWGWAEDLVQTALERVWPRWGVLVEDGHRLAYTRTVLTRLYVRDARRRWRSEAPTADFTGLDRASRTDVAGAAVAQHGVLTALSRLPPRQRSAVVLRHVLDMSERDTARALRCPTGTVKTLTARGIQKLRTDPDMTELWTTGVDK